MIRSILIFVFWSCVVSANSQQIIEKHMDCSKMDTISLNLQIADSIRIQTWIKDEVYVKGSVNINDNQDNDAYVTSFSEDGNTVIINANFSANYFKGKKNCCNESQIYWQIFIPEKVDFSVETINGNITITGNTKAMKVMSISGYIDLAVPSTRATDIELSTYSGRMYSNLDINPAKKHNRIPMRISEELNDGGDLIKLETISGNIFIRKSN